MNIFHLIKKLGFACTLKKIKRRIFINDNHIISLIALAGAFDYLQKYKYVLDFPAENCAPDYKNPYPNKIWTCWLQGVANAPLVVQNCIRSIVSQHGKEVIVLDQINIENYIQVPDYIQQKWKAGTIGNAHYADVVRIILLSKYGGTWIDSTTFLLDKIPTHIRQADIFAFKCKPVAHVIASNWFIVAQESNDIILKVRNLLFEYWKKENKLASYSIFHLFFTMAVNHTDENKLQWRSTPYFDDVNCKILQNELFHTFNDIRWAQIKQMSVIQKLSYKFSQEEFDKKETFYNVVVKKTQV
jgi:mannosyltransferase OCH1-like enzyme